MTDTDGAPGYQKDGYVCPHCGHSAHMVWRQLWEEGEDGFARLEEDGPWVDGVSPTISWFAAICQRCHAPQIWREDAMIYPRTSTIPAPHADLPDEARELYEEGRAVAGISPRAGAALARASLERALRSLDPVAGSPKLDQRIEHVIPELSVPLVKLLTAVRHSGNKSLHVEDAPDDLMVLVLDPDQVQLMPLLFAAVNQLADELVARPRAADEIFAAIPGGVRANVEAALGETDPT